MGGVFLRGLRCGCGHTLQDRSDDRIDQGESHVVLGTGQALLLNCRTPQSYCTAPGQSPLQYRKSALKPQEDTR